MEDYKRRASDLGVPPELLVTETIFTYYKNLLELCRCWQQGRDVIPMSLYGTLDMLQLSLATIEALVEERQRG